jgi:hypothetical protein
MQGSFMLPHRTGKKQEYQVFLPTADGKELDSNNLDKKIYGPFDVLNSVPYRGRSLDIDIALYAIESGNLAAPYIKLLKNISDAAGISLLSQSIPLVDAISTGISDLVGKDSLEIGRCGAINPIYSGYYAVVGREKSDDFSLNDLEFDPVSRELRVNGKHMVEYPYFILEITTPTHKTYYHDIPDISNLYNEMIEQFMKTPEDFEINNKAFFAFEVATELSPDLLSHDAKIIVEAAHKEWIEYLEPVDESETERLSIIKEMAHIEFEDYPPRAGAIEASRLVDASSVEFDFKPVRKIEHPIKLDKSFKALNPFSIDS